jgi:hypothetical protein
MHFISTISTIARSGPCRFGTRLLAVASVIFALGVSAPAEANISDSFSRADSAGIGNGWIEKNPDAFALTAGQARKLANFTGYRDNIVYRPAAEDVADVEASVELRITGGSPGYPQLLVRVQSGTVAFPDALDGYILYVSDSFSQAIIGRQRGSNFVAALGTLTLAPSLNTTDNFRLRLRATGSNPVLVEGFVERQNGTTWQVIGQSTFSDSATERLAGAGSVGFGGYVESSYSYDNFVRTNLGGTPNPAPATSSLMPASALAGESGLVLTVTGSGFNTGSLVRWNGSNRTTAFISANVLEATIPASDLAAPGTAQVTVFNPAPGGGTSNAQAFTITANPTPNPIPAVTQLNPASVVAGSAGFALTVNGSGFATGAVVRLNGVDRATAFVSSSQLTATVLAGDIAAAGNVPVTVFNPTPGGGVSNTVNLTVTEPPPQNPAPVANLLSPSVAVAGSSAFTLTVQGQNFIQASTVRWNGSNRTTTFVSGTELRANISAGDVASAGTANVTVFTPTPGGGTSQALVFTISPPGGSTPSAVSLAPLSATAGDGGLTLTVNGGSFTSSSVVRWNGQNLSTTFVSSSQLRATVSSSRLATVTIAAITVQNSGGAVSLPLSFYVVASGSQVFFDGFNRANSGNLGNGWTEKMPVAFSLSGNAVVGTDTYPYGFPDNIVTRPSNEDQLNVEVAREFVRQSQASNFSFPQVHARIQRNTLSLPETIESYIFFVDETLAPPGAAVFAVQPPVVGVYECVMVAIPFPSPLQVGSRYRLRFRVEGTYPVQLSGIVERFDGAQWQVFVSGSMVHDNNTPRDPNLYCPYQTVPAPISSAGALGFAKWTGPGDPVDNFHWISLGGSGPALIPNISGLSPTSASAGSPAFAMTVNGTNFNANSVVRWNGSNRTTTYISATQLQAAINAADVASAGSASVTVFNPNGGSGTTSTAVSFTVTPTPGPGSSFTDEFTRADSDTLGNGWIEKTSSAFFLLSGEAAKQSVFTSYRDNVVYRPASENVLNVEAAVQLRLTSAAPGYPQLFTRVQTATVGGADTLDAYMLYIPANTTQAILGRQRGASFVTALGSIDLAAPLNTTNTYRMRLSATGTTTVQLQAYIERLNGSSWEIIGQTSATDSSAQRISTAGSVGFGGYIENAYTYDRFTRTNLP